MIIHETLATLGISAKETDTYLALLRLGPSSIRDVADASGINRGSTYEILKVLKEKSLVSYFPRGKRRLFCAEPAEALKEMAKDKQRELDVAAKRLNEDIVPNLQATLPLHSSTSVRHYEGDDGVEYMLKDILRTVEQQDDKLYRVYSSKLIRKYLYRPFPNFTRQRVQRDIHVNVIAIGDGGDEAPLASRKWIDPNMQNPGASYVAIYPNKCAMVSLTKGDYPTVVIMESTSIAAAMTLSFDALWHRL